MPITDLATTPRRQLAFEADDNAPFRVEPTGLTVRGVAHTFEEFEAFCRQLHVVHQGIQFAVGDALRWGEETFGERASQIFDASEGWSEQTLRVYRWCSEKVPPENRRADLTFAHHLAVAACGSRTQRQFLARAAEEGWSVSRLKAALREGEEQETTAWLIIVTLPSAKKRDALVKKLELEGIACKATERKKVKEA